MKKKVWRYRLERPATATSPRLADICFGNDWLSIYRGKVRVSEGYAWDGCSPAFPVPHTRLWLGPPDGPLGTDGRPAAWRASLFHDALCQFRRDIPTLTKAAATALFAQALVDADAPAWMQRLYPLVVFRFGPQDFPGDCATAL